MAQDYDKILKENMEELILPLSDKLLGVALGPTEELPDDLQNTLERKPDLLKRVTGDKNDASYLLHIEFQVKDETTMVDRMLPRGVRFIMPCCGKSITNQLNNTWSL